MANDSLLDRLNLPEGLKTLDEGQLRQVCMELRQRLLRTVSKNGGHLASNLGVVELTVALHTVFDTPLDQIMWDVGHQSYVHKMLTGRLDRFSTIRRSGGLSGFPHTTESGHDPFLAGHASTSLSVACGLAKAKTLSKDPHTVVAVVGDGALTGGMIYEAMNHAGRGNDRLIMILNDNAMSISRSVGSFARYLATKRSSEGYLNLKYKVEDTLLKIPVVGRGMRDAVVQSKTVFRQLLYHSNLFEDFGFDYLGPIDGHDLHDLIQVLTHAKELQKPVVVHVNTVKGKGYALAEKNPDQYHGVGSFDRKSGVVKSTGKTYSSVFGERLAGYARKDETICAITAAMCAGTGLSAFAEEFEPKDRFFDVGIAEEHAVTFACGLAAGGLLPVFAVYSTFLQRSFDQLVHDGAIEPRHIVLGVDRAGFVGDDGETHQGLFDAAFLSQIPGTAIYSPASYAQLDYALERALYQETGITAVRYPRGNQNGLRMELSGDFTICGNGGDLLFISYGRELFEVEKAVGLLAEQGKQADVLALTKIWPLSEDCVAIARRYPQILFVEEGVLRGGIGEHFLTMLCTRNYRGRMRLLAVENPFLPQMSPAEALERSGLDAAGILRFAKEFC